MYTRNSPHETIPQHANREARLGQAEFVIPWFCFRLTPTNTTPLASPLEQDGRTTRNQQTAAVEDWLQTVYGFIIASQQPTEIQAGSFQTGKATVPSSLNRLLNKVNILFLRSAMIPYESEKLRTRASEPPPHIHTPVL